MTKRVSIAGSRSQPGVSGEIEVASRLRRIPARRTPNEVDEHRQRGRERRGPALLHFNFPAATMNASAVNLTIARAAAGASVV